MSTIKTALTVTSVGTALLFGGGIYLYMNFAPIAKNLAEKYASQTLGVKVSIADLEVHWKERRVDVSDVTIANPPGYTKPYAATIQTIGIQAGSLNSELLEFKDVAVNGTDIYLEVKPNATNLTDIRNNVNKNIGENPSQGEKAIKVILDKMVMNGTIHPSVTLLGNKIEPVKLPEIRLSGIGRNSNGVLVNQAVGQIWKEISTQTIAASNKNGFLKGIDRDALTESGIGEVEILKEQIDQEVDKVKDGLKSLFE